jgi:hypothetical protein
MARYFRCLWYDEDARSPHVPGHPLYVYPRQGAGRVDDPRHGYRVLYVGESEAGVVAEAFGDYAVWTRALLFAPPHLPGGFRAIVEYDVPTTVCDLDDAERLVALGLRPSDVVSSDRERTQRWARDVYDSGEFDGVSWWSRRDARWTSTGLWAYADATVADVTVLFDLTHPAVTEAAAVLLRPVSG